MKTKIITALVVLVFYTSSADAQVLELVKIITEKVIKAIDLRVQEMQNSAIVLQNTQRQAENNLSKQKLAEIGGIAQQEKDLFKDYYASLLQVKPSVLINAQVRMIRERQTDINALYSKIIAAVKQDRNLQDNERRECTGSCGLIMQETNQTMQKVEDVLTNQRLTATDADRLRMIGLAGNHLENCFRKLSALKERCWMISAARVKSGQESQSIQALYGL